MTDNPRPPLKLNTFTSEMAVLGGAVLGAGGGGKLETGLCLSQAITDIATADFVSLTDLSPQRSLVVLATFRASGFEGSFRCPPPHKQAIRLLQSNTGIEIAGLLNCGSGAVDTLVGWTQAIDLGVPLLDVTFDPAIHPSPVVGLIKGNPHFSFAIVGDSQSRQEIKLFSPNTSPLLFRMLCDHTLVEKTNIAMAIGPVSPVQVQQWGAMGRVSLGLRVGKAMLERAEDDGERTAEVIAQEMQGETILFCVITDLVWQGEGDEAYGIIYLRDEQNRPLELLFWHRYIALERQGQRLATFPDLIVTLGIKGTPLSGDEVCKGQEVYVVAAAAPRAAASTIYQEMENITGKAMHPSVTPSQFSPYSQASQREVKPMG